MARLPVEAIYLVAEKLTAIDIGHVFVGGAVIELLLDDPELTPIRPTDDVDVIIEVFSRPPYAEIEAKLRDTEFQHDVSEGAPMCRWILDDLTVDIMPAEGGFMGLNTTWFKEALENAVHKEVRGIQIPVISPVLFLATKYNAFLDRGNNDYYGSHDLEDFLAVVDGRESLVDEINASEPNLRQWVADAAASLINNPDFNEALSGHLPGDTASQQRLPMLVDKLKKIAGL